ncbi:MAG: HAMP domain-containing histidine kinase [Nitrospirae bacterium YQR-1]
MVTVEQFFRDSMDHVFLVYGLAFVGMGIAISVQPKSNGQFKLTQVLRLLSLFALLHGLNEWVDMLLLTHSYTALKLAGIVLLASSFCFLFEFGRKTLRICRNESVAKYSQYLKWWLMPVLLTIIIIVSFKSEAPIKTGAALSRYFLALPGSVLTAVALRMYSKETDIIKKANVEIYFLIAAISFVMYGVLAGIIVPKGAFFPADILNTDSFLSYVKIPVQLFRAVVAIVIAFSMVGVIKLFNYESRTKLQEIIQQLRRKEEEISTINMNLQRRVEEEVAKNRAMDQLMYEQSRHLSMAELLVNISHHWRQPLCAAGLLIQDIKEACLQNELDEICIESNIENAMSELNKLSETIDNFRSFYVCEKERTEFNIADKINKAVELILGNIENKGVIIDKELDYGLTVNGSPAEFANVILNVLTNAKDKFEKNDIADGTIRIKLYKEDTTGRIIITIADNGNPIPENIINKVFEPYFTTKDMQRGTGMGLYMAKIIIEKNMKGSISLTNIDGWCVLRIEI